MTRKRVAVLIAVVVAALGGAAFWSNQRVVDYTALEPSETMSMRLDLSERRLYVKVDGEQRSYRVSVGSPKYPTPPGNYAIDRVIWNPRWIPPDADWARGWDPGVPGDRENPIGLVKMNFRAPAYYIHGTPYKSTLGTATSHGCVRMTNADAIALGRLVMEHGGASRDPSWYGETLNAKKTKAVRVPNPIRFQVTN